MTLSKLESELGSDMLASALGLQEDSLRAIIQGRQPDADTRYFPHICTRLEDAGIPSSVLDGLAPITPQVLKKLKGLAAGSDDRIPLRRNNFKRLAKAFGERLEVLADALEMRLSSIVEVADGRLRLDEERFGHLNPRLMRAGFPNGWLNEADPELPQARIDALTKLAEAESEEEDAAPSVRSPSAPPPTVPTPIVAKESTPAVAVPNKPNSANPGLSFGTISRHLKGAELRPMNTGNETALENSMSTKAKSSKGTPAPAASQGLKGSMLLSPSGAPTSAGLPRGAHSAGRAVTGRAAPTPNPSTASSAAAPKTGIAGKTLLGAPPPSVTPATQTPQNDLTSHTREALGRPELVAAVRQVKKRSEGSDISRETSLARAAALDKLLETSRRSAKVTLWRDLLGRSLPYWGNIRRGGILMKDDLSQQIIDLLQLPEGWLDNPTFPPATLAPWVVDANVPLPETRAQAMGETAPASSAPPEEKAVATHEAPSKTRGRKPRSAEPVAAPAAASPTTTPSPVAKAPAPAVAAPAPAVSAAATGAFTWTPPAEPHPIVEPGPLTQALASTLSRLSVEGKFSEQDAMRLLYYIMNQPGA